METLMFWLLGSLLVGIALICAALPIDYTKSLRRWRAWGMLFIPGAVLACGSGLALSIASMVHLLA